MRILVTGGAGFIGSHVARRLVADGHDVTRLTRRPPDGNDPDGRCFVADLEHEPEAGAAFQGQDGVVHCAGPTGLLHGSATGSDHDIGVTSASVAWAARAGVRRFVHLSSLAVCAPPRTGRHLHEGSALSSHPEWNGYGRTKTAEECLVRMAHGNGRIEAVVLRPGITFGPGDRHAAPLFHRALSMPAPFLVGSGRNPVAALAVEDLADAVALAVTTPGIEGRCYALASANGATQRELFDMHAREYGVPAPRWHLPLAAALGIAATVEALYDSRGEEPPVTRTGVWLIGSRSCVDTSRARIDLGWIGNRSIEDAIARSIAAASSGNAGKRTSPAHPAAMARVASPPGRIGGWK